MAKSSPDNVYKAYLEQFRRDLSLSLSLGSEELVRGGCMFLTLLGRSIAIALLTISLLELVEEVTQFFCSGFECSLQRREVFSTEPMLATHFGGRMVNPLFAKYAKHVAQHLALHDHQHVTQDWITDCHSVANFQSIFKPNLNMLIDALLSVFYPVSHPKKKRYRSC